mmetsp:Transcript_78579/g.141752  ORF Transcript_78579/g.141752 Transcript_78579/m.141752 type:complete len:1116 (-) Transcript_78579:95-3442(-)
MTMSMTEAQVATLSARDAKPLKGGTGSDSPVLTDAGIDNLDGCGWVVVEEAETCNKAAPPSPGGMGLDAEGLLALKKRVWQMRVCQRKTASRVAAQLEDEADDLDEAAVETLAGQVESLREQLGLHWTWFEEELLAGRFDSRLRANGDANSLSNVLLPPSADSAAFPSLGGTTAPSSKGVHRMSPTCSARSTPQLRPKASPHGSPEVDRKQMPPQEVWMAAERHRKSNFFGAAVFGPSMGAQGSLFSLLTWVEVSEALSLGMTSTSFAKTLLDFRQHDFVELDLASADKSPLCGTGSACSSDKLWRELGWRANAGASRTSAAGAASTLPFSGDPAFKPQLWARQRAFATRVGQGLTRPAAISQLAAELGGPSTRLGPFLPAAAGSTETSCCRLVVGDGRQLFRVVDIGRRREEEVEVDRYGSKRLLSSSLGAHPAEVTSSWPIQYGGSCVAGGGVLAARPAAKTGPVTGAAAFQWLELPDFDRCGPRPENGSASLTCPNSGYGAAKLPPASPNLAFKKSPTFKASTPPARFAPAAPPPLLRVSVGQEAVAAAIANSVSEAKTADAPSGSVMVDAMWTLPGRQVLVLVREELADQVRIGGSQAASPSVRPSPSPKVGPKSAGGRSLAALDLPAAELGEDLEAKAILSGRRWLQVWESPAATERSQGQSPEPVTSFSVSAAVTCIDTLCTRQVGWGEGAGQRTGAVLLFCGLVDGTAELRQLGAAAVGGRSAGSLLASWAPEAASRGSVSHVLLRPASSGSKVTVVAIQAKSCVKAQFVDPTAPPATALPLQKVLPNEAFSSTIQVAALRPVGECGFAVCSSTHVYAFEAQGTSPAVLTMVVQLPAAPVRHFEATPYEFFAVLDDEACQEENLKHNSVCCLWPAVGDKSLKEKTAGTIQLKAWASGSTAAGALVECEAAGVYLGKACLSMYEPPSFDTLALHSPACGQPGFGLLAISASGPGVGVFQWGLEVNPEFDRLRKRSEIRVAEEARQREMEVMRRQLGRLQQRLLETDKLADKLKDLGQEALTEEELAKLQRRPRVELDIAHLTSELGLDACGADQDVDSEEEEQQAKEAVKTVRVQKQREKEKVQKAHHEDKRAMQKERNKCRERKLTED